MVFSIEYYIRIWIAPEHLPRLFERFYRADPARARESGGTGLGLAIVHRIVSDYGGTIQLSSTVGVGTTFRVTLPAEMNGRKTGAGIDVAPIGEEVVA